MSMADYSHAFNRKQKNRKMKQIDHPSQWKYSSPEEEGFHEIITPENSACKITWIYRLNLSENVEYLLRNDELELN